MALLSDILHGLHFHSFIAYLLADLQTFKVPQMTKKQSYQMM